MLTNTYGTYHADKFEADARWGARLIHREVNDGLTGLVGDRQSGFGDRAHDLVGLMAKHNVLGQATGHARSLRLQGNDDSVHTLFDETFDDDHVVVLGSPQGSYGYLYVTALLNPREEE